MCSVVSRAILKLVYWFGIPNSNLQMLISVDFWCKLLSIFLVAELREWCFELFRTQNSQKFAAFCPWTPLGRASTTPDSPAAQWLFSSLYFSKNRHPPKIAGCSTDQSGTLYQLSSNCSDGDIVTQSSNFFFLKGDSYCFRKSNFHFCKRVFISAFCFWFVKNFLHRDEIF